MPIEIDGDVVLKIYEGSTGAQVEVLRLYAGAIKVFESLEDGSLVIEDDTLAVSAGGTVNLRVKLGARPGSNVIVAVSESITGVSVSPASRTFTPTNWNVYQNFVVAADSAGASFTLNLAASTYNQSTDHRARWDPHPPRPNIPAPLGGTQVFLRFVSVRSDNGRVDMQLEPAATGSDFTRADLSDAFENSGSIELSAGGRNLLFAVMDGTPLGTGRMEPYTWFTVDPMQQEFIDTATFWRTNFDDMMLPAVLTIREYDPRTLPSGSINLSASGPSEYDGVTASAMATVT